MSDFFGTPTKTAVNFLALKWTWYSQQRYAEVCIYFSLTTQDWCFSTGSFLEFFVCYKTALSYKVHPVPKSTHNRRHWVPTWQWTSIQQ